MKNTLKKIKTCAKYQKLLIIFIHLKILLKIKPWTLNLLDVNFYNVISSPLAGGNLDDFCCKL